jgi:Icc-related predicted phosphoesterase
MRIAAISDLHGSLPEITSCDLLLIAGDVAPFDPDTFEEQYIWFDEVFRDWLNRIPATSVIMVAGNHDYYLFRIPEQLPQGLRCQYIVDEVIIADNPDGGSIRIYGSPWISGLPGMAFNLNESALEQRFLEVPRVDIMLTHMPPYGICDLMRGGRHMGSSAVAACVKQMDPLLHIYGHIHEARGVVDGASGRCLFANVAHMNEFFEPTHPATYFDLVDGKVRCEM